MGSGSFAVLKRGFIVSLFALVSFMPSTHAIDSGPHRNPDDDDFVLPVSRGEIKVMSYNVENLFDTLDDDDKEDETFLPIEAPAKQRECGKQKGGYRDQCFRTDWTENKLQLKLDQIRRVVQAQGQLPDILILAEIENENVVRHLASRLGYRNFRISDGPDRRGIDVAVLWRADNLTYVAHEEVDVSKAISVATRPILKVTFQLGSSSSSRTTRQADSRTPHLVVFANHWPSQGKPPEKRMGVAQILKNVISRDMAGKSADSYHAIAMGDFNTREDESPNALTDVLLDPSWRHALTDVHDLSDRSSNPMNGRMPIGTYYFYQDGWHRFDKILISRNLHDGSGLEILPETFRVLAASFMNGTRGKERIKVPMRYDFDANNANRAGFSDHYPVTVKLRLR